MATSAPAAPVDASPARRRAPAALRHLDCLRWGAVTAAGVLAARTPLDRVEAVAALGASACVVHLSFAYNDLCDAAADAANPRRAPLTAAARDALRSSATLAALLLPAFSAALPLGAAAAFWAVAALGLAYSHPRLSLKARPGWSQACHAACAVLLFEGGRRALAGPSEATATLSAAYFASFAVATSLAGEVQDLDSDAAAGLRTTAAHAGRARAHAATGLLHAGALALLPALEPG
ncbi:MAG: UbiA family prenyltransferase, partial [Elusimicrobiota bacterium]|nr:UbiA family prenyltransferase [Elusimicrobiota bacterium]